MGFVFEAIGFVLGCVVRLAWHNPKVTFLLLLTWLIARSV